MRVKSLGLANARPPGSAKFANAPPLGTDKAGKWPAVAREGGGGGQLELTDALTMTYLCTYQCNASGGGGGGGGGGRQGIGWGFDFFQKISIKFPAHGQSIPVKCNQISPPQAAHCCQSQGWTQERQNKNISK